MLAAESFMVRLLIQEQFSPGHSKDNDKQSIASILGRLGFVLKTRTSRVYGETVTMMLSECSQPSWGKTVYIGILVGL
ncbi:hypothetical protein Tco_1194669 [Tanacetum coccineum]